MAYQKRVLRVGSRKSELALVQSNLVINLLKEIDEDIEVEIVTMDTIGDKVLDIALSKIGDKSLFTKELELALLTSDVDIVVHSLKDVSTTLSDEFVLGCVCLRESNDDVVIMRKGSLYKSIIDLPEGSVVGTSSVRRVAQLKKQYGDKLKFESIRGNLNTRLLKLDDPIKAQQMGKGNGMEFSAIIIAKAGAERLGWQDRISQVLNDEDSLYAVGQGALAVECRANDKEILNILSKIHDERAALTTIAERSLMHALDGGCSTPIAVRCTLSNEQKLTLRACVLSVDGKESVEITHHFILPLTENDGPSANKKRRLNKPMKEEESTSINNRGDTKLDSCDVFMGIKIDPICSIGRYRMQVSKQLGESVAKKLLSKGANHILSNIKRTAMNSMTTTASSSKMNHESTSNISPILLLPCTNQNSL